MIGQTTPKESSTATSCLDETLVPLLSRRSHPQSKPAETERIVSAVGSEALDNPGWVAIDFVLAGLNDGAAKWVDELQRAGGQTGMKRRLAKTVTQTWGLSPTLTWSAQDEAGEETIFRAIPLRNPPVLTSTGTNGEISATFKRDEGWEGTSLRCFESIRLDSLTWRGGMSQGFDAGGKHKNRTFRLAGKLFHEEKLGDESVGDAVENGQGQFVEDGSDADAEGDTEDEDEKYP